MLEIKKCRKCNLCNNQRPLLDKSKKCDVMWVGLSAKKVDDVDKTIPLCPLMSVGSQVEIVCMQENCAWYLKNYKICSVYMMAHNSMLDVQAKQRAAKQNQA